MNTPPNLPPSLVETAPPSGAPEIVASQEQPASSPEEPMVEPLHPSNLSEILDRTAQIYRSRFLVFLGIAVIPTAALLVFAGVAVLIALQWGRSGGGAISLGTSGVFALAAATAGLALMVIPALLAATALATAAMNHAASRAFLGQPTTIRDSYKSAWRRGWPALGLYIAEGIAVWVAPIGAWSVLVVFSAALAAVAQGFGMGGGGVFVLLGFLIVAGLVVYAFWMALRLSLAFPALMVEQVGAWPALRRSVTLTRGTKGRIFLLYLLGLALNWLLSAAITLPLVIVIALLPGADSPQHAQLAGMIGLMVAYGAAFAVQAITKPVYGIALMLFYYDQRIRQEAFDIEWMMLRAGLVVPPAPSLPPAQSLPQAQIEESAPQLGSEVTDRPVD